jgi:hypothetical protein
MQGSVLYHAFLQLYMHVAPDFIARVLGQPTGVVLLKTDSVMRD